MLGLTTRYGAIYANGKERYAVNAFGTCGKTELVTKAFAKKLALTLTITKKIKAKCRKEFIKWKKL